jgi:hypothetical protein
MLILKKIVKENKEWFWVLWNFIFLIFFFVHGIFKIKLLFDNELAMVLCYMTQSWLSLSFWNGRQNVVLNPLQFPINYSSPTWFPYLWHAMLVYVPNDKTNPKKRSFLLCLVWGLRHINMHKVIMFVVKRASSNFKYSFWTKHGWCWMKFIHNENVCVDGKWSINDEIDSLREKRKKRCSWMTSSMNYFSKLSHVQLIHKTFYVWLLTSSPSHWAKYSTSSMITPCARVVCGYLPWHLLDSMPYE